MFALVDMATAMTIGYTDNELDAAKELMLMRRMFDGNLEVVYCPETHDAPEVPSLYIDYSNIDPRG